MAGFAGVHAEPSGGGVIPTVWGNIRDHFPAAAPLSMHYPTPREVATASFHLWLRLSMERPWSHTFDMPFTLLHIVLILLCLLCTILRSHVHR